MKLVAMKFCRFKNEEMEWCVEGKPENGNYSQWLTLENINLIVGKNASGKSRTIDAIRQIADLLAGDTKLSKLTPVGYGTAEFHLIFDDNGIKVEYFLDFKDGKITQEFLNYDGAEKLNRQEDKLFYEQIKDYLAFQTDDDVIALSRRDSRQQPFFESLYEWGESLTHYKFGSSLGRDMALRDINLIGDDDDVSLKNTGAVAAILIKSTNKFGSSFVDTIKKDMASISYDIDDVKAVPMSFLSGSAYGIGVREKEFSEYVDQSEISQGMFRVLSLIIQLNFSLISKSPSCILIDDIGEGLDFERSKKLIDLVIEKVSSSNVQVIMTTNDRFVMNKIDLKYWSVIQRIPKKSLFFNYKNSKETFDDFEYTGLSNFDFLSTEFYTTGLKEEVKQ